VAVAVGELANKTITSSTGLQDVRPYIRGLVEGLGPTYVLGGSGANGYEIRYRQRPDPNASGTFDVGGLNEPIFFCMSTTVVTATQNANVQKPVVAVVSDPDREGVRQQGDDALICGVQGLRDFTAGECFLRFLQTVPSLTEVIVLNKPGYNPSVSALGRINRVHAPGVRVTPKNYSSLDSLKTAADDLPARLNSDPATVGALVLPVDIALGAATKELIPRFSEKKLPNFFPITDYVTIALPSALGGYGASQFDCGKLMARQVDHIWRNNNTIPPPADRWIIAPNMTWVASREAASDMGVTLGPNVPHV
jgi:hypothetical protein